MTALLPLFRSWTWPLMVLALAACGGGGGDASPIPPLQRQLYLEPVTVGGLPAVDRVAIGYSSSCMLTPAGEAWCWGSNEYGKLGAATTLTCSGGTIPCSWQPVRAAAPLRFGALSLSLRHGCGIAVDGQAHCWGFGVGGQLGDGRSLDSATPVVVAGGHRFVQIDAGDTSLLSCALDAAGAAWCWGPAGGGALGNGTTDMANRPVQVQSALPLVSIGVGEDHACALDATGQAWCWGRNTYGKLGLGMTGAALTPATVSGSPPLVALAIGGQFSCGLDHAGAAWCWGFAGALGDGGASHRNLPTAVAGGHVFASLSAGYQHACGLKSDGQAWCWGGIGLAGHGSEDAAAFPVAVAGGHRFRALQAGGVATCGITLAGTPMCWGSNSQGAVGQNNVDP